MPIMRDQDGSKLPYLVAGVALLLVIVIGTVDFRMEMGNIRRSAEHTFEVRTNLIRQYIRLMRQNVYALEHAIESRYRQVERDGAVAAELSAIEYHPRHGVWGVSGLESEGGIADLSGTLTGLDSLREPSQDTKTELTAVLDTDHLFQTLVENVPDIIWVYYTSVRDFIYISPDPAIADFRFSETVHTKPFWTAAIPENNPDNKQVISELYDDYYGQGLMISISSPVFIHERFTGVASLDLGIDLLRELTGIGTAEGTSILVGDNGHVVARHGEFELTERYDIPLADGWVDRDGGAYWLSTELAQGELRLLHRLPKTDLTWAAARRATMVWIVLAAMFGLVLFSLRLSDALSRVRTLMHRDTLTDLLNRRGFEASVVPLREAANEEGRRTALLLLDIDHFKQINDTLGHEEGDKVLITISQRLSVGVKEFDLVCRWGGEELLVFLVYDDAATLKGIAERLRASIAERPITDHELEVTVSGGLITWQWQEPLKQAIDRADKLMYSAKSAGRNRIVSDIED